MSAMGGYERDEYEEDLDEYEDDCGEQEYGEDGEEYEYEEEQVHKPTPEELEYLAIRQRLKDDIRKKMNKELGTANGGSRGNMNASRKDKCKYGSFFGPSQPVIAQRVIQESKSLMENPNLAAKMAKLNHSTNNKNRVSSNSAGSKPRVNPPKAINGMKKKVELIKDTRDYSFLLSEDAEIPVPSKTPKTPQQNLSAPKSDARSAQLLPKSNKVDNDRGRDASNNRDRGKPVVSNGQTRPKVGLSSSSKSPMEYRKQLGSNNASGPGRPVVSQGSGPSRSSVVPATVNKVMTSGGKTNAASGVRKPMTSVQPQSRRPATSHLQSSGKRPLQSGVNRGPSSNMQSSVSRSTTGRKEYHESNRSKDLPRPSLPSSREVKRPLTKLASRGPVSDQRPKPKPGKRPSEYDDESTHALSMLRNMIGARGYDPSKYRDDDDDSDMEAGFEDIQREEKRSARIARQEDEEQARLLEEEERRRRAKKRKVGH